MLINPNFKIEDLGENQLFFINKNKGTGYYVDNINLSRLRTLEEQGIFFTTFERNWLLYRRKYECFHCKIKLD